MSVGSDYQIFFDPDVKRQWAVVYHWTIVDRCETLAAAVAVVREALGRSLAEESQVPPTEDRMR